MATPYANNSGSTKDLYNFYHSQLRIQIECTFGMLTHRCAILRSAIPMGVSIKKNCCTRACASKSTQFLHKLHDSDTPCATASDAWQSELNGAVPLVATTEHYDSNRGITPINCCMGDHTILMILELMAVLSCNNDTIAGQGMPMYNSAWHIACDVASVEITQLSLVLSQSSISSTTTSRSTST